MKRISTLLFSLLLLAKISTAQSIVSFRSLGRDDEVIGGVSGSTSYFIKIDPDVQIEGSRLVLFLEPSQVLLRNRSFINILVNGKPVYSTRVSADSIMKYTLNLNKDLLTEDHRFLKLQIRTLLAVSDDKCKDLDNPSMWVKVKARSYLSLIKTATSFFNNVN